MLQQAHRNHRSPRVMAVAFSLIAVLSGCSLFKTAQLSPEKNARAKLGSVPLPSKFSQRASQFVFVSDFEIKGEQNLFRDLAALREQVIKELQLPTPPSSALVHVYLFEDRARYEQFMNTRYPSLPRRRAFFVSQPRGMGSADDLLVYTFWGDHIRQDLRHELTHAILHSVLKDVPLWLDEGLAEYFEQPVESRGINRQHVLLIGRDALQPDLARLEQLSQVDQMNPAEYREAWAWVHFMLRGGSNLKPVLLNYLQQLRKNATPGPLLPGLLAKESALNDAMVAHLVRL